MVLDCQGDTCGDHRYVGWQVKCFCRRHPTLRIFCIFVWDCTPSCGRR